MTVQMAARRAKRRGFSKLFSGFKRTEEIIEQLPEPKPEEVIKVKVTIE